MERRFSQLAVREVPHAVGCTWCRSPKTARWSERKCCHRRWPHRLLPFERGNVFGERYPVRFVPNFSPIYSAKYFELRTDPDKEVGESRCCSCPTAGGILRYRRFTIWNSFQAPAPKSCSRASPTVELTLAHELERLLAVVISLHDQINHFLLFSYALSKAD